MHIHIADSLHWLAETSLKSIFEFVLILRIAILCLVKLDVGDKKRKGIIN